MLLRRAYAAAVIRAVLAAQARGLGYRRIALRMRLPEATVRDWLRAYRRAEPRLRALVAPPGPVPPRVRNTSPPHAGPAAASARAP